MLDGGSGLKVPLGQDAVVGCHGSQPARTATNWAERCSPHQPCNRCGR